MFRQLKMQEKSFGQSLEDGNIQWQKLLKVNHQIVIEVTIEEICPLIRQWGNLENQLIFDRLKFHLHHLHQVNSSNTLCFSNKFNLYHRSQLVQGKLIKSHRQFKLRICHKIRYHNILLYSEMAHQFPLTIIAEASYGALVGFAQLQIPHISGDKSIQNQLTYILFKQAPKSHSTTSGPGVFTAKAYLTIQSNPIAPQLDGLVQNIKIDQQLRKNSRSPTPTKVISKSPTRSTSPKIKRKMISHMISGPKKTIWLTVYQKREYRYGIQALNPTVTRQLVYKNTVNIKEKKIELVKIQGNYFLKFLIKRDNATKRSQIVLTFNEIDFNIRIVENNLLAINELQDYQKEKGDGKFINRVISIGNKQFVYARDNQRILKNIVPLTIEEGLLGTIFVKSHLPKCQIYCSKPFTLSKIEQKGDGYMITYFYQGKLLQKDLSTSLVIFVDSEKQKETHIFLCSVKKRSYGKQNIQKDIQLVKGENFFKLGMKMTTNENYEYTVRSSDQNRLQVVNGTQFKYQAITNQNLILQILADEESPWPVDLLFHDSKGRSFFLKLTVIPPRS